MTSEPVTTGQLVHLIERSTGDRVSTQTIRNHADAGRLKGTKTADGWRFDPSVALEQWTRNRPTPKKGGKRRGAGRKKRQAPAPLTREMADIRATQQAVRARLVADEHGNLPPPPPGAMPVMDVLRITRDELTVLASFRGRDRDALSNVELDRIDTVQRQKSSELKLAREMGELVPAAEIAAAWTEAIGPIAARVEDLPKRVAARVATACWPGDEKRATIARVLRQQGVDGTVISAVLGELARPPELAGRVRVMIADEVGKVMSEIAKAPEGDGE